MMQEILEVTKKESLPKVPTILITGGSRGSQIINNTVEKVLEDLVKKYKIIHQTGELDYELFLEKSKHLGKENYEVYATISPSEMGRMYERADIYIGRSGANTVAEIVCCKIPSILIPIPWSRFDEQNQNAKKAQDLGIASILPESELSRDTLIEHIEKARLNWKKIVSSAKKDEYEINQTAAKNLVNIIFSYI
jgi:UDP-N-acetylglucosamine--N-acetylmuramyl-(pentapeptide) pyrophosphoryl-undecaprenol N-acetylglucosamine transferase